MSKVEIVESKIPLVLTKTYAARRAAPPQLNVDVFESVDQVCTLSKDVNNVTNPTATNTFKFGFIVVDLGADYMDYDRITISNVGWQTAETTTSADIIYPTTSLISDRWFDDLTTPSTKRTINSIFTSFPPLIELVDGSLTPVNFSGASPAAAGVRSLWNTGSITYTRLNSESGTANTRLIQSRYIGYPIGVKSGKNPIGTCYATLLKWK